MRTFALAAALIAACVAPAWATPVACPSGSLATYTTPGYRCTFGTIGSGPDAKLLTIEAVTFFGFSVGATPAPVALPTEIDVVPPSGPGKPMEITSDKFSVSANQRVFYFLSYLIDPPPPVIGGFDMEMLTNTPVFPGSATITTDLCPDGFFGGPLGCIGTTGNFFAPLTIEVFHKGKATGNQLSASVTFPNLVRIVSVRHVFDLNGGGPGGTSEIRGIGTTSQIVPEPGAGILAGVAFAALALYRKLR